MAAARTPAPVQYSKVDGWSSAGGGLAEVVMCSGNPGFNTSYVYFASPAVDVDGAEQAYSSKDVTKIGQVFKVNGNNFGLDSPVSAAVEYDRDSKTFAGWSENCVVIKQPPLGKTKRNTVYGDPEVDEQGFCISKTSWENKTFKVTDRERYVDAMRIPYFVLPPDMPVYTEIGACGFFVSTLGGQCGAVYADAGNSGEIGEISWNLAKRPSASRRCAACRLAAQKGRAEGSSIKPSSQPIRGGFPWLGRRETRQPCRRLG